MPSRYHISVLRSHSVQENNGQLLMESPGPAFPLKTAAKIQAQPVDDDASEQRLAAMVCSLENKDECLMCGS